MGLIDPSGFSRPYDHELASALAARGLDVTLWTSRPVHGDAPPPAGYAVAERFYRRTNRLPAPDGVRRAAKAAEHVAGLAALRRWVRDRRPDVLHVQWSVLRPVERRFYGRLMATGTPAVFTAHDPLPNVGGAARRRAVAATARAFPRVIVHSEWGRRALIDECRVAAERIRVIPHGVLAHLRTVPVVDPPFAVDGPTVVLPGLIRPYKGTDVLLAAWPDVRSRIPDARLVIAGRPMMDLGTLRLDQPGVTVVPRFLSESEMAAAIRAATVVVLPYRSIDNSGVVSAALALGAGVILSDVGGFREMHDRHGVGDLVPPADPPALAAAIVRALDEPEPLRGASVRAAEGALGWAAIAELTESVYRELAGSGRRHR
ncbi:MAG TPA: glycosyltransferase family 4 protein [Thermoleophilia bacterium]|nr:glycosyltransferase family 4 protein [Thermoleophilia bacterium]